ncbi:hypothetical protein [Chryseobacterium sp. Mn2064]|uniref:hypothetical protein n=1 Tax=Chryseobacterium sp. Mn2064 TaxID=3395263 RepID=UPI003BC6D578
MKIFLTLVWMGLCQICLGQSLIEHIKFDDLKAEEQLQIEKINQLLPQAEKIRQEKCNEYVTKYYGCIMEYKMVYVYNNQPIMMDESNFNRITNMYSDGSEGTNNFMSNTRTYILNWNEKKYISKRATLSRDGISVDRTYFLNQYEIQRLMDKK